MTRLHPRHSKLPPSLLSSFSHIMCYLGLSVPPSLLSLFCHMMCYLGLSVPPSLLSLFCHMMCYLGLSVPPSLLSSATLCFIWVSPYHRHCCHLPHYVLPGSLHTTVLVVICHIMCYLGLSIPPSLLSSATLCVTWVSAYHRPCCHLPHYVLPGSLHTTVLVVICHIMLYLGLSIPPSLLSSATLCVTWVSAYHRPCCHLPHYVLPGSLHTTVLVVICHIMCYLGLCIPPSLLSSATLCVTWVSAYHRPCCHLPHYVLPGSLNTTVLVVICHIMLYLGLSTPPLLFCHIMRCLCLPIQPIVSVHSIACCSGEGGGGGRDAASDNFLLLGLLLAFCSCEHWNFWVGPVFDVLYPPLSFSVCLCVFALRGALQGGV